MRLILQLLCLLVSIASLSQAKPDTFWHLQHHKNDYPGISWNEGLELVKTKTPKQVVVAVIDAGTDIKHPDLKEMLWTNTNEIADNGIDDDNNGYIDDVNGWNFIGDVTFDNTELVRQYVILNEKYELKSVEESEEYTHYLELKDEFLKKQEEAKKLYNILSITKGGIDDLEKEYGDDITKEELKEHKPTSKYEQIAKILILQTARVYGEYDYKSIRDELIDGFEHYDYELNYGYNPRFEPRDKVGDDYTNGTESGYGNNKLYYGDRFSSHGTHVSGIIAASSTNKFGAKGICQNCEIMTLRTVPQGDERDKDVANSIRYAVNNGAKVINMSFGKSYTYRKDLVYNAIEYAKSKEVLLIHSAGNDASNNDLKPTYPNDMNGKYNDIWIEVGASSWQSKPKMLAEFTNYGATDVDVFSPGVAIYSTMPENTYEPEDGTSMAGPVVAGIAGVIRGYYPQLTASQVKTIIVESAISIKGRQRIPGKKRKKGARKLSATGSVVNLYTALEMAEKIAK